MVRSTTHRRSPRIAAAGAIILAASVALLGCSSSDGSSASSGGTKAEKNTVNFAYSVAVMQLEKVPLHLAMQDLSSIGMTGKESFSQDANEVVQSVARGESDFGIGNASTVFTAIKTGVPIKAIMTTNLPDYVVAAPSSIANPCDLGGKRVGIQAKVSSVTLYTDMALGGCTGAKPNILVLPGSAARVQAMIAGQLDASAVQYPDMLTLTSKAGDKFHSIYDVASKNPGIIDSVLFTSTATLEKDPNYVKAFVGHVLDQYKKVYEDVPAFAGEIEKAVPNMSAADAQTLAKQATDEKIWPVDGGFGGTAVQDTLDAIAKSGMLPASSLPTASDCCTAKFIPQS